VQPNSVFKSIFLLILLGFIWGSGYSLAKYAMTNSVSPLGYAFWQSLGPALLLSFICIIRKQNRLFSRSHWPYFFTCGLIGIAIPNSSIIYADLRKADREEFA